MSDGKLAIPPLNATVFIANEITRCGLGIGKPEIVWKNIT